MGNFIPSVVSSLNIIRLPDLIPILNLGLGAGIFRLLAKHAFPLRLPAILEVHLNMLTTAVKYIKLCFTYKI